MDKKQEEHMKGKNNWACFLMILAGIVIGGFIGNLFPNTFLNYGQVFGLSNPVVFVFHWYLSLSYQMYIKSDKNISFYLSYLNIIQAMCT